MGFLVGPGTVGFRVGFSVGLYVGASIGGTMLTSSSIKFLNLLKLKDPRPDAGSHPTAALNPWAQHNFNAVQLFRPIVTSVIKVA